MGIDRSLYPLFHRFAPVRDQTLQRPLNVKQQQKVKGLKHLASFSSSVIRWA